MRLFSGGLPCLGHDRVGRGEILDSGRVGSYNAHKIAEGCLKSTCLKPKVERGKVECLDSRFDWFCG